MAMPEPSLPLSIVLPSVLARQQPLPVEEVVLPLTSVLVLARRALVERGFASAMAHPTIPHPVVRLILRSQLDLPLPLVIGPITAVLRPLREHLDADAVALSSVHVARVHRAIAEAEVTIPVWGVVLPLPVVLVPLPPREDAPPVPLPLDPVTVVAVAVHPNLDAAPVLGALSPLAGGSVLANHERCPPLYYLCGTLY